ncbi:hypothetical protein [Streptomyces microflavus]|uniref:hypothetical protein n=1 Tax=Streptomyces microflavus TaxID=1919 RepID=UPI00380C44AB
MKTVRVLAALRRLTGRDVGRTASGFRTGPLLSWCPAERSWLPHRVDAGGRRCISCKTFTTTTSEDS